MVALLAESLDPWRSNAIRGSQDRSPRGVVDQLSEGQCNQHEDGCTALQLVETCRRTFRSQYTPRHLVEAVARSGRISCRTLSLLVSEGFPPFTFE